MKRYKPEDYPKYDNYDAINVICLMEESRRLREAVRIPQVCQADSAMT